MLDKDIKGVRHPADPMQPYEMKREKAKTAVLFFHGFLGSPFQFWDLADSAYESGCSAYVFLLPGHGKGITEFKKVKGKEWESFAEKTILNIVREYEKIIIVGHSMGGLLALKAAGNPQNHICGVMLMNTPVYVHLTVRSAWTGLKVVLQKTDRQNEIVKSYAQINSVKGAFWQYPLCLPRVFDLLGLMRRAPRFLSSVQVPVLITQSQNDEIVGQRSVKILERGLKRAPHKKVILKRSWHSFYEKEEWNFIKKEFLCLLKECGKI